MKAPRARAAQAVRAYKSASTPAAPKAPAARATAPLIRSFIVLGAEPQAGQTCVTAALLRTLGQLGVNAVGMKPVARGIVTAGGGWQSDELQQLAAASAFNLPARALCAHLQRDDGLSPQADERPPTLDAVLDTFRVLSTWADTLVVDCATGAPFGGLALTRKLGLPFVYVVGAPDSSVPDAAAAADGIVRDVVALIAAGAECVGWIAVAGAADEAPGVAEARLAVLRRRMPSACLGVFVCGGDGPGNIGPSNIGHDNTGHHHSNAVTGTTLDLQRTLRALAA